MPNPYSKQQRGPANRPAGKHSAPYPQRPGGKHGGNAGMAPPRQESNTLGTLLKLIIEKYNLLANTTLNLSALRQYEELKGQHVDLNTVRMCDAICSCLAHHFRNVDNVAFDKNVIKDPTTLLVSIRKHDLHGAFKGLSMCENPISDYRFLQALRTFPSIQELRFLGCPIANDAAYRRQVSKNIPNLLILDGEGVERFTLALPWPQYPGGTTTNATAQQMAHQLLAEYCRRVEECQVDTLAQLYHPHAMLSITCSQNFTLTPSRGSSAPDMKEFHRINQDLTHNKNRNLAKASSTSAITNRVSKGFVDILGCLKRTLYCDRVRVRHRIDTANHVSISEPATAAMKEPIMIVKIHGIMEFVAQSSQDQATKRVFDRTWVVVSTGNGDIVISNDMLHLRAFDVVAMWDPHLGERALKLSKKFGLPSGVAEEIIQVAKTDYLCTAIAELVARSKLRPHIASGCLGEADNDLGRAWDLFESRRAALLPEHFCM